MRARVAFALALLTSQASASFQEQMQSMMVDPSFQEYASQLAQPMEAMMEEAHQMQAALNDPRVQKQMERVIEPMKALMADPEFQKQVKRVAEQVQTVFADPNFQEDAKRMEEPLMAMLANPEPRNVEEQFQTMMTDPNLQELTNRIAEPINEMMSDDTLRDHAKVVVEQVKIVMGDPTFQKQFKRISEPMVAMMDGAKQMQEMAQQMQERRSLASLLLATNPTLGRSFQVPMSSQNARNLIMSDDFDARAKGEVTPSASLYTKMLPAIVAATQALMPLEALAKVNEGDQMMVAPFLPGLLTPIVTLVLPLSVALFAFVRISTEE